MAGDDAIARPAAMLTFDPGSDRFVLAGVAIGRGTRMGDVTGRVPGGFVDVRGHLGFCHFDGRYGDLHVALHFRNDILESGCFVAVMPGGGSWAHFDEDEAWRRDRHAAIMRSLFGARRYASPDLVIDPVIEPHDGSEQLRFAIP